MLLATIVLYFSVKEISQYLYTFYESLYGIRNYSQAATQFPALLYLLIEMSLFRIGVVCSCHIQNIAGDSMGQIRIFLLKQIFFFPWHPGPTGTSFNFFSTGNDEAVADTSRRVGGALARKSALRNRLNSAIEQLQATERGKDQTERTELKPRLFVHWYWYTFEKG